MSEISTPVRGPVPFNTPLETGLRSLAVLSEAFPQRFDLQQLQYFDYLIVHSGDVEDGPPSIHPPTPHRSSELSVRRGLIERGLLLMLSRGLVDRVFSEHGIDYSASDATGSFLDCLTSEYASHLKDRAAWVIQRFGSYSGADLIGFFRDKLDRWGSEFTYQTLFLDEVE